jgi:hypothetical protein
MDSTSSKSALRMPGTIQSVLERPEVQLGCRPTMSA